MKKQSIQNPSPKVSIIIPCYNYGQYLQDAVKSCIDQTWTNFEIIIINDGSSDNTLDVAKACREKYSNYNVSVINQENQGLVSSRNNAIIISSGEFILPLDADDLFEPGMIECCVNALLTNPKASICYTNCRYFGDIEKIPDWIRPWDFAQLCEKDILCYASMYRRRVWDETNGYSDLMNNGYEDWEFWIRAGRHGFKGLYIDSPLFLHRIHGRTMYAKAFEKDLELKAKIALNNSECYSEETLYWAKAVMKKGLTDDLRRNFVWKINEEIKKVNR